MPADQLTFKDMSVSILNDMIEPIVREVFMETIVEEQQIRAKYGQVASSERPMAKFATPSAKASADESEYFECLNCGRKIVGGRFAAHIDRCLGGRSRK